MHALSLLEQREEEVVVVVVVVLAMVEQAFGLPLHWYHPRI